MEQRQIFQPWSKQTLLGALICFLIIACFNGLFSLLFDVVLFENEIGYAYFYFVLIFFTIPLYYCYTKYQSNWFGLFSFGLCGIIGIGVEYWLEYELNQVLISPWGAVGWGFIYIAYGLLADLSMYSINIFKNQTKTVLFSAFIFALGSILISIIPLTYFYKPELVAIQTKDFLTYSYFLIPYAVILAVIGAYTGMNIANKKKN